MVLKISKGVWFVSVLGVLAALLYVYANLPEQVLVMQQGTDLFHLGREGFFYASLAAITLVNALVFVFSALFKKDSALRTWFNLLTVCLNVFFVISFFLVSAINSFEKFNFEKIGFMVYGSLMLIALCALGWPVYWLIRKFSGKPSL